MQSSFSYLEYAAKKKLTRRDRFVAEIDTSIKCDPQHFEGFLKVSLEEELIALRDDSHLLNDPAGLLHGDVDENDLPGGKTQLPGLCTRRDSAQPGFSKWLSARRYGQEWMSAAFLQTISN